jgi:glucose/arabinose dehydrogenase
MRRVPAVALSALLLTTVLAACGSSMRVTNAARVAALHRTGVASRTRGTRFRFVALHVPASLRSAPFNVTRRLRLPAGWHASLFARVSSARFEAWTPQGSLLVSSPGSGDVIELSHRAHGVPKQRTLLSGLSDPQGLAFDRLNGQEVLYVAESDQLDRYVWTGHGVGARTILVRDLPDFFPAQDDEHGLKEVAIASDHTIYLDIGSSSNASPDTTFKGTPRATVIAYRTDGTRERVFATGVRNGDGLSFAPDGTLWTAVNERDNITYPFHRRYGSTSDAYGKVIQSYVNNHPPDEVAALTPGRNLGWPYCNPDPDVHRGAAGTGFDLGNMGFDDDSVTNPGGSHLNCAHLTPIERGLPAHSAPLGFHFLEGSKLPRRWAAGAVVGGHGSWDRQPPRAPVVYWLPWEARHHTLGRAVVLVTGFQASDGSRWGRPVDVVPGPDGALYVSDDTAGAIYRIVP